MSTALDIVEQPQPLAVEQVTDAPKLLPLTAERKMLCAEVLVKTGGNISRAAELLGTTRQNIHRWAQTDPAFRELFEHALEYGTDNLEESYYTRAMNGSDRATEFLLRARRPEKYRDGPRDESDGLQSGDITRLGESLLSAMMDAAQRMRAAQDQQATLPPASMDQMGQSTGEIGHLGQPAITTTATGDGDHQHR